MPARGDKKSDERANVGYCRSCNGRSCNASRGEPVCWRRRIGPGIGWNLPNGTNVRFDGVFSPHLPLGFYFVCGLGEGRPQTQWKASRRFPFFGCRPQAGAEHGTNTSLLLEDHFEKQLCRWEEEAIRLKKTRTCQGKGTGHTYSTRLPHCPCPKKWGKRF